MIGRRPVATTGISMSDKPKKEPEPAAAGGEKKAAGGGMLGKLPVLLGGVMIIEAVVLFAGFKFLGGGPKPAQAELAGVEKSGDGGDGKGPTTAPDKKTPVEVSVVADFRGLNRRNGHAYLYSVDIVALTHVEFEDQVKKAVIDHGSLIRDRIRTIIAQSDPEKLGGGSEPGLETLRRQVKYQLDEIIGEGLIDEVLVPKCIPFRTD
jgi:flagellar basal body-associated protein FliL